VGVTEGETGPLEVEQTEKALLIRVTQVDFFVEFEV
jgi:hypothetical protein